MIRGTIPNTKRNLSTLLVERVTRKFWDHLVSNDEWPRTKENLEKLFKEEFYPHLRSFEEKRVRFCHTLACLFQQELIQEPTFENSGLILYRDLSDDGLGGKKSECVVFEVNVSESVVSNSGAGVVSETTLENTSAKKLSDDSPSEKAIPEEDVVKEDALGETVPRESVLSKKENTPKENGSGQSAPKKNVQEENVIQKCIVVPTKKVAGVGSLEVTCSKENVQEVNHAEKSSLKDDPSKENLSSKNDAPSKEDTPKEITVPKGGIPKEGASEESRRVGNVEDEKISNEFVLEKKAEVNVPEAEVTQVKVPQVDLPNKILPRDLAPTKGISPKEDFLEENVPKIHRGDVKLPEANVAGSDQPEVKLSEQRNSAAALATQVEDERKAIQPGSCDWINMKRNILRNRNAFVQNKYGVRIMSRCDGPNGVVNFGVFDVGATVTVPVLVRNTNHFFLDVCCVMLGFPGNYAIRDCHSLSRGQRFRLPATKKALVSLAFKARNPGNFKMPVAFLFRRGDLEFNIVRFFVAEATDALVVSLAPVVPYTPPKRAEEEKDGMKIVSGPPPFRPPSEHAVFLKKYPIPEYLLNHQDERTDAELQALLKERLTLENHRSKLSLLLHIDEMKMTTNIRHFDLHQVHMLPSSQYLALEVPGLSENRPSLLRGDCLYARVLDSNGKPGDEEYQGYIHHVCRNEVLLKFHERFHRQFNKQMMFRVRFVINRTPVRLKHRALALASSFLEKGIYCRLRDGLEYPGIGQTAVKTSRRRFFDCKILTNSEQKQAVENIVAGTSRPLPYIVFGPPGTGKTVTVAEAIKQVLFTLPYSNVLACAPSNSAADLLLERVVQDGIFSGDQVIRMNAFGRSPRSMDPKLLKYCVLGKDDEFCIPPKRDLMKRYRLVITTLVTAGRLVTMGIPETHFTHVFIDEAGQASEPEVLIPIAGLFTPANPRGGQLILAGDPKQLGPTIYSALAESCGLSVSLLERLMSPEFPYYNKQARQFPAGPGQAAYNPRFITKLLNNYRSHPALLKIPNDLFYHGELRPCADTMQQNVLCDWPMLPCRGFPVLFEGVCGVDHREETSPSFFNAHEISVVMRCVLDLKYTFPKHLTMSDIGIISPYYKQVKKIRELLSGSSMRDIRVGSVEEFQGQERKVIIITTVRSSQEYLQLDAKYKLGFLKNPKRFNVAVTRAKALLVVVGNPHVLSQDPCWRRLLEYCVEHNAYRGCAFDLSPEEDSGLNDIIAKLNNFHLETNSVFNRKELQRPGDELDDRAWVAAEYY